MGLFRNWRDRKVKVRLVPVPHYAPDVDLTSMDYIFPLSSEQRAAQAQKRINDFLAHADPDRFCETFFDQYVKQEEALLLSQLAEQTPNHQGVNGALARKHQSELIRLWQEIRRLEQARDELSSEICSCQALYDSHNQ